jgi:hypothetical protein
LSQIDLAPLDAGASEVEIGADKGGAAKRSHNAAGLRRLTGEGLMDSCPNSGCVGTVIGKLTCQGSDKVAVAIQPKDFKARQATLAEASPVIPDCALL